MQSKIQDKNWFYPVILVLLSFTLFFLQINMPLTDGDTAYYATIARNIVQTNEWQSLHFQANDFVDKPPFSIWPIALSFKIFGYHHWSLKLFNSLLAVLSILLTYLLALEFYSHKTAFWSGLIFLTSVLMFYAGQVPQQDVPFVFTALLTYWGLVKYQKTNKDRFFYLVWLGLGLTLLNRSIPGLFLIVGGIIFYFILSYFLKNNIQSKRKNIFFTSLRWLIGLLILFVTGFWWFILEYQRHGLAFLDVFIGSGFSRYFNQSMQGEHINPLDFWVEIPLLIAALIPWSGFIWHALRQCWENKKISNDKLILLSWFIVAFGSAMLNQWRVIRYLLPALPPLCILIAHLINRGFENPLEKTPKQAFKLAGILNLILAIPLMIYLLIFSFSKVALQQEYFWIAVPVFLPLISGMIIFAIFSFMKRIHQATNFLVILTVISYLIALNIVAYNIDMANPWPKLTSKITSLRKNNEPVIYLDSWNNPFISYYLGEHPTLIPDLKTLNNDINYKKQYLNVDKLYLILNNKISLDEIKQNITKSSNIKTIYNAPLGQNLLVISFNK